MSIEDRVMELEIRVARQDDLVDTLNRQVYEQQKTIAELQTLCAALARRLGEIKESLADAPANDKPPHY